MNTTKRPSRMPKFYGMLIIMFVAPAFFVLGFGANKKKQATPQKADMIVLQSGESADVPTQSGVIIYIYADSYTVNRNDAVCKVEDVQGKEIPLTLLQNQKIIPYDGSLTTGMSAIASFNPTGESVRVYCDLTSKTRGEFLIGSKMSQPAISLLMILYFMLGFIAMGLGFFVAVKNIYTRKKWFEKYAN